MQALESEGVAQLAAGAEYSLVLSGLGGVFACGRGTEGQLGLGEAARKARLASPAW